MDVVLTLWGVFGIADAIRAPVRRKEDGPDGGSAANGSLSGNLHQPQATRLQAAGGNVRLITRKCTHTRVVCTQGGRVD